MSRNNHFNLLSSLEKVELGLISLIATNLDLIDFHYLVQTNKENYRNKVNIFTGILTHLTEKRKNKFMLNIRKDQSREILKAVLTSIPFTLKQELFFQAAFGNVLLFSLLLNEFDINQKKQDGRTVVHEAAQKGYFLLIQLLLTLPGIIVDVRDEKGRTPLYLAAKSGIACNDYKPMFLLVKAGADPYIQIDETRSPPYYHLWNHNAPKSVIYKISELHLEYEEQKTGRKYNDILENILKKIKTFKFKLQGDGVTVDGIDHPIPNGAADVFYLIKGDIFRGREKINRIILETEYEVHASKIKSFLKNKTKSHSGSWFLGLGARDKSTADFYTEIIDSLNLHKQNNHESKLTLYTTKR